MDEQRYLNVEMKVKFDVPVSEDFDIDELSEEDLKEIANDYLSAVEFIKLIIVILNLIFNGGLKND